MSEVFSLRYVLSWVWHAGYVQTVCEHIVKKMQKALLQISKHCEIAQSMYRNFPIEL